MLRRNNVTPGIIALLRKLKFSSLFYRLVEDVENGSRVDERNSKDEVVHSVANEGVRADHSMSAPSKVL